MRVSFITLPFALIALAAACKKRKDIPAQQGDAPLVATTTQHFIGNGIPTGNMVDSYYYFDNGKRAREITTSDASMRLNTRRYTTEQGKLILRGYIGTSTANPSLTIEYTLNNEGNIEETFFATTKTRVRFQYNNGYLTQTTRTVDGIVDEISIRHYTGTILDSVENYAAGNNKTGVDVYTYSPHKNTIGDHNMGLGFSGKDQSHAWSVKTRYSYVEPLNMGKRTIVFRENATYTADNKGRIGRSDIIYTQYSYSPGVPVVVNQLYESIFDYTYK